MVYNRSFFNRPNFISQQPCILCGTSGPHRFPICPPCKADLPQPPHACARCALPLPKPPRTVTTSSLPIVMPESIDSQSTALQICGQCSVAPPVQDRCFAAFQYGFPIRELITALKFQQKMVYGRALGTLLGEFIAQQYVAQPYPDAIVAVPLSRARLKERGFNQAEAIARYALQEINRCSKSSLRDLQSMPTPAALNRPTRESSQPLKLLNHCIEKVIHTAPQTALSGDERKQSLNHAFQIKPTWHQGIRSIAIIDDVYTTGATLKALSELFRAKGVEKIHLWCVARTV